MEAPLPCQFMVEHTERVIYWQLYNTDHINVKAHTSKDTDHHYHIQTLFMW